VGIAERRNEDFIAGHLLRTVKTYSADDNGCDNPLKELTLHGWKTKNRNSTANSGYFTDTRSIGCTLRRVGVPYPAYASTNLIKKIYGVQCWRVLYYLCAGNCQSRTNKILKKKILPRWSPFRHLLFAGITLFFINVADLSKNPAAKPSLPLMASVATTYL
jgi:hypothetical protein